MAARSGSQKSLFDRSPDILQHPVSLLEVEERVVRLVRQRLLEESEAGKGQMGLWRLSSEIKIMYSGIDDEIENPAFRQKSQVCLSSPHVLLF